MLALLVTPYSTSGWSNTIIGFLSPLFAAGFGGYAAFLGIRRSQRIQEEEEKIERINRHIYQLKRCLVGLVTLKKGYFDKLGSSLYRTLSIRRSVNSLSKINVDVSDIQFLLKGNVEGEKPLIDLVLIDSAFENYNLVLEMWKQRDRTQEEFLTAAQESGAFYRGDGSIEGDVDSLVKVLGQDNLDLLVHVGERLLQIMDTSIDQLTESLDQLQTHASKKIDRALIPEPTVTHYYISRTSAERKMIENPVPEGEWENKPYFEEPPKPYPIRERLMASKDLPEFENDGEK